MAFGKVLLWAGLALAALGAVLLWAPGLVSWFGRLPGDIRVERPGFQLFIPVTSMIVVSVGLALIGRFLR